MLRPAGLAAGLLCSAISLTSCGIYEASWHRWLLESPPGGYGDRGRTRFIDARPVNKNAEAVALMTSADSLVYEPGSRRYLLRTVSLRESRKLCDEESFWIDTRVAGDCTAFLIAPTLVLTAGHCAKTNEVVTRRRFVFGFQYRFTRNDSRMGDGQPERDSIRMTFSEDNVYSGVARLKWGEPESQEVADAADWVVIMLDRKVYGRAPLELRTTPPPKDDAYMIGHPMAVPAVFSFCPGPCLNFDPASKLWRAEMDAFGGNSGSPVFDAATHQVIGLLQGGEPDWLRSPDSHRYPWNTAGYHGCHKSRRCRRGECQGEKIIPIAHVIAR